MNGRTWTKSEATIFPARSTAKGKDTYIVVYGIQFIYVTLRSLHLLRCYRARVGNTPLFSCSTASQIKEEATQKMELQLTGRTTKFLQIEIRLENVSPQSYRGLVEFAVS